MHQEALSSVRTCIIKNIKFPLTLGPLRFTGFFFGAFFLLGSFFKNRFPSTKFPIHNLNISKVDIACCNLMDEMGMKNEHF